MNNSDKKAPDLIQSGLRAALQQENPLQIIGTINAYSALLAKESGFNAIYLSGAGVANACFGLPDLGITTLDDVTEEVKRITDVCDLPLLVDADTGWGDPGFTVKRLSSAGAAGVHIEDQIDAKRCGHRPGKHLISTKEMVERLEIALSSRDDNNFIIMARTDAYSVEGLDAAIKRAQHYVNVGADMIFAESFSNLDDYNKFINEIDVPVLANITEFGQTPLYSIEELRSVGVQLALYPLSAFRAMSAATLDVYGTIRREGTQKNCLNNMQARKDLYKILNYHEHEKNIDTLLNNRFKKNK